uniref:Zinc finger and BTB domain containing 7B n=2 Tax=Latimeria chalumnae TaxID=7897 RepID=H3B2H1_LATCH
MGTTEDGLIGIPFPEHSNELLSSLNEQRHKGLLCDVTIKTRGLEYRTHRAVLAACSQYFKKLFTCGTMAGQQDVCELDFVEPEVMGALLEFAYTATLTISSSNMREMLHAAQMLEIQCVMDACADILRSSGGCVSAPEPPVMAHGEQNSYEKNKQYLDCFAAVTNGICNDDGYTRGVIIKKRQEGGGYKKRQKFLRNFRSAEKKLIPEGELPPAMLNDFPYPPKTEERYSPIANPRDADPASMPISENSNHRHQYLPDSLYNEEQRPPLHYPQASPEQPLLTDEETVEPGSYWGPTNDPEINPTLSNPDKLVRKRRSQMPQECPVCHKIIHGAGKLPRHMRTHTGEKPFACEECGVRFTRNDKLKIHMRKHTGERPYSCDHCEARFLHSYDLKNHMYLHTGDRPFECTLCHKAFAREDHLQRHLKGQNCLEVRTRKRRRDDDFKEGDY